MTFSGFFKLSMSLLVFVPMSVCAFWMDDFETLDTDRWLIQCCSWAENACNMRSENVEAVNSMLRIHVTEAQDSSEHLWDAGGMGDQNYRMYGLLRARMKPSKLKGAVSAFFIMNEWVPQDWEHKEIDIEFLGKNPTKIQLTTHDFQEGGSNWLQDYTTVDLGFDFSEDFHEYAILWMPDTVRWFVDGEHLHSSGTYVPNEPLEIRTNFYIGNQQRPGIPQWLGPIDSAGIPAVTECDWIRYDPIDSLPTEYQPWVTQASDVRKNSRPRRAPKNSRQGILYDIRGRMIGRIGEDNRLASRPSGVYIRQSKETAKIFMNHDQKF